MTRAARSLAVLMVTLVTIGTTFALLGPASAAAAGAPTVAGTWSCCGSGGAATQTWTITESGGSLSGTASDPEPFSPISGSISGTSVTIVTGPYTGSTYSATFVGTISGETMSGTWTSNVGQEGTWIATRTSSAPPNSKEEEEKAAAKKAEEAKKKREEEEKKGRRASATSVSCYYEALTSLDICTAQVGDASGQSPAKIPSGAVAFTINHGGGGFQGSSTCALAPSQTGGASSFCAVDYRFPTEGIPIGEQPPITATYSGDSNFSASSSSPKSLKAESPLEELPTLCLQAGVNCEGVDLTLPDEPTINELDTTELALGCYDQPVPATTSSTPDATAQTEVSAHTAPVAHTSQFTPNGGPHPGVEGYDNEPLNEAPKPPPLPTPKKSSTCNVQAQLQATKEAQAKEARKLQLLKQKLQLEQQMAPLNQKLQKLQKAIDELSDAWGGEGDEAPVASTAKRKHKRVKPAIPFGAVRVEIPEHASSRVKLAVPKADRIFVSALRQAHISVLHLQIRVTVVRTGDKKATSFTKTVTYKLSKK
jgi:hypothetical protein